jgi:hypothetical protein
MFALNRLTMDDKSLDFIGEIIETYLWSFYNFKKKNVSSGILLLTFKGRTNSIPDRKTTATMELSECQLHVEQWL